MKKYLPGLLIAVVIGLLLGSTAMAQSITPPVPGDDAVNAVARQLYCPVCENIPLDVCGTQACAQWRELIRDKLSQGWTENQIKQYFVDQYGDRVLETPPVHGFNWLVYVIPPVAILAGVFILYRAFQTWRQPDQVPASPLPAAKPDEYVNRLEEELRKR